MLFVYILSLTPGLSSNFINLFTNPFFNTILFIVIIIFSNINIKITLLLLISYMVTYIYIQSTQNMENMKNIYNKLSDFI